ncbi:AI-2E family transporter [Anaerococcus provencensis]|uniref:AI-2E family transporter n=1 Tax=Anaerococcus provencensis TaxID=938293 RepID=UPI0002F4F2D2|nr:AI-2E family transporter [Anaerococcus provencensis]
MDLFKEFLRKTGIGIKEYIKSSLITSAICFALLLFGLYIGNVPYFGLVAFAIAVIDMLPVLGSGIILIPWSIIAFVQTNNKLAFILIIIFILSFVIEQVLQPLIFGKSVGLKPIYTLLITIISMIIFSPALGAIIGSIISIIIAVIIDMKNSRS